MNDISSVVTATPYDTTSSNADPILGPHVIHWLLSREVYNTLRRPEIEGWNLVGGTADTVMYHNPASIDIPGRAIIAFRGSQTLLDIRADIQLSRPGGNGCDFDKLKPAEEMISNFLTDNPDVEIQLTGHSLGGAIARCAGQKLGLGIVTFNSAAPPSNPVYTGPNEIDYHIVFDFISAWQSDNTVRIDKGYRPPSYSIFSSLRRIDFASMNVFKAHSIDNFSNQKKGKVISGNQESTLLFTWYNSLPKIIQHAFNLFTQTNRLPPVEP